MKIIKRDKSWNWYDDILIQENVHPLYTSKIVTLLNAARITQRNSLNAEFVAVEDDYKLHVKEICF
jgi:hypothetical protein